MCVSPISVTVNGVTGFRRIQVPCGHCVECLKQYQNQWMIRCFEEFKDHKKACFVTLTYNEENCPVYYDSSSGECFRTVCKKHVQDLIKRYRTNYERKFGKKSPMRFFITSEYGPRTFRPHYHGILFGVDYLDVKLLLEDWRSHFGFYKCSNIDLSSISKKQSAARYVAKYCSKGVFECPYVKQNAVDPTFHLVSKGLGLRYVDTMKDWHLCLDKHIKHCSDLATLTYAPKYLEALVSRRSYRFPDSGISYKLPQYYVKKIYGTKNRLSQQIADFLFHQSDELREQRISKLLSLHPDWTYSQAFNFTYLQDSESAESRKHKAYLSLRKYYDKSTI